jgi:hydrogenase maturation factor
MYNKQLKIAGIFLLISSCFLYAFFSIEKTEQQKEVVVSTEDKNKEAVRVVVESELTVPNKDYILIQKSIDKKMDEIRESLPEGSSFGIPEDSEEWLAYEELVRKTYGPYFMDYAYDDLIPTNQAFRFHFGTEEEQVRYQMKVSDIQVTQSKNESSPKNYDFTALVDYTNNAGKVTQHEIKGVAILSEVGKIGKYSISDVGGLMEKISEDNGSTEINNQQTVRTVLESEFTVPNEEYLLIVKNIDKKMTEIGSSSPQTNEVNGVEESGVSDEWLAYEDLVKRTYGPYFMDYFYDDLIPKGIAFSYHYGLFGVYGEILYEMKISDIQVTQSENVSSPKKYDFIAQIDYTSKAGEVTQHEIKGMAILSEPGKIGKFVLSEDGGLGDKIGEDRR